MNALGGEEKEKRRIVMFILAAALVLGLAAGVTTLLAVHGVPPPQLFELDGNAVDNSGAGLPDDWDTALGIKPGGSANVTTFVTDPAGANETTHFKGGDKDTEDIPNWHIVSQTDTPKDDIEHAYAAAYTTADGDLIIYAGDDRFDTAGTASHGFWFFKNPITINDATHTFNGIHADGDVLLTVEFQQGGTKVVANVFEWDSQNNPNLKLIISGEQDVTPGVPFCNADDTVCGITNAGTAASPWFYYSKDGDPGTDEDFPPQSFFEMGINITELTGGTCFASFLASSRTSASETSTIKDFVLGSFTLCGVDVTKTCVGTPTVSGGKLLSTFNVTIESTGSGTIHAVTLAEEPLGTGESCKITAIAEPAGADANDATKNSLPVTFDGTNPVTVYDTLAGGTEGATVTIECLTGDNPFIDTVKLTAKTSASLTTPDLNDDYTTGDGGTAEICPVVGNPKVMVQKCCKSVTIDPDNFTPTVCVSILLTNTSDQGPDPIVPEPIQIISVKDDRLLTVFLDDPNTTEDE